MHPSDKVSINIPFEGFYESKYSGEIDNIEEREAEYFEEYRQTEDGIPKELQMGGQQYAGILFDCSDYSGMYARIARLYAAEFSAYASEIIGVKLGLEFEEMVSPREYNFTTDRIFALTSFCTVEELFAKSAGDGHKVLREEIERRFTSCSGFISHYSNDLSEWLDKPLEDWDHNELGTLLIACLKSSTDYEENYDWRVYENVTESEGIYDIWSNGVDWEKVDEKIQDFRDDLVAESKSHDPDYVAATVRCPLTPDLFHHLH